jgi:hypothetical protein
LPSLARRANNCAIIVSPTRQRGPIPIDIIGASSEPADVSLAGASANNYRIKKIAH